MHKLLYAKDTLLPSNQNSIANLYLIYPIRRRSNLKIISLLKKDSANPEHLKTYSGWGGLRKALSVPGVYQELKSLLTSQEMTSLEQTLTNAYYTPIEIVQFMYDWLRVYGFTGGDILEPSVGQGVFIEHMPQTLKDNSVMTTVELDSITSQIFTKLYPYTCHHTIGFEHYHSASLFDLIIGNPPYGAESVEDSKHPDLKPYKIHHYFVAKSMRLLKEGGILAMVLPSYFLDNVKDHVRHIIHQEGGALLAAYRLPDDLFKNAKVTVDIVFLIKGRTDNPWLSVRDITVSGFRKPMNTYYHQNSHHILGNLEITDMYERKGLTCKQRGSLKPQLDGILKSLHHERVMNLLHSLAPAMNLLAV